MALKRGEPEWAKDAEGMKKYADTLAQTMMALEDNFNAGRENSLDQETVSMLNYVNDEMMKRYIKKELECL